MFVRTADQLLFHLETRSKESGSITAPAFLALCQHAQNYMQHRPEHGGFRDVDYARVFHLLNRLALTFSEARTVRESAQWRQFLYGSAHQRGWFAASTAAISHATARGFYGTVQALQASGVIPPRDWLAAFETLSSQGVIHTFIIHYYMGIVPSLQLQQQYFAATAHVLESYDGKRCSQSLYALATLGIIPPQAWLTQYIQVSVAQLRHYPNLSSMLTLSAIAQLLANPGLNRHDPRAALLLDYAAQVIPCARLQENYRIQEKRHLGMAALLLRAYDPRFLNNAQLASFLQSYQQVTQTIEHPDYRIYEDVKKALHEGGYQVGEAEWHKEVVGYVDFVMTASGGRQYGVVIDLAGNALLTQAQQPQTSGKSMLRQYLYRQYVERPTLFVDGMQLLQRDAGLPQRIFACVDKQMTEMNTAEAAVSFVAASRQRMPASSHVQQYAAEAGNKEQILK
jgi:hypothetical protein